MIPGPGGRTSDWLHVARSARLGEVAEIADWYVPARIEVVADDAGTRVVQVTGDVASGTAAYLDVVLDHVIAGRPPGLVVDLSAASFIGVRGVAALLRGADRALRRAVPLRVVVPEHLEAIRILARTGAVGMLGLSVTDPSPVVPDRPGGSAGPSTLSVAVDRHPDHALVTARGELAMDGVGTLAQALAELLLDPGHVVVDLSHLRLGWIPAVQTFPSTLAAVGGWPFARLVLFGVTPDVTEVLHAVHVTDTVPLARDHAAALAGLGLRPPTVTRYHVLEPHLGSPRRARALLRRACLDWALGHAYDDAALVVTELVTDAVGRTGTSCRLDITLDDRGLLVAVRDQDPPRPPRAGGRRPTPCGAVTTLARGWGVVPHTDGTTVWAHFPPRGTRPDAR